MFSLAFVAVFAYMAYRNITATEDELSVLPRRISDRIGKLWDIAHQGMRDQRFLRAEKALLTILKIDEKNAAAYNRLGILYAKQKEYRDAIDCFEIASSIEPSASSYHNLGLIYFETENFDKAAVAFEHALELEDTLAARHIAYAKVLARTDKKRLMVEHLEKAVEMEPNKETYQLLQNAYEENDMPEEAKKVEQKLKKLIIPAGQPKRIRRPRRVVI